MEVVPLLLTVAAVVVFGVKASGATPKQLDLVAFGWMLMALFQLYYIVT